MTSCAHENYRVQTDWKKGRWNREVGFGVGSPAPSWVHGCTRTGKGIVTSQGGAGLQSFLSHAGSLPQLRHLGQSLRPGGHCWSSALGDSHFVC